MLIVLASLANTCWFFGFSLTELFCDEIAEVYRNDEWRLQFEKAPVTRVHPEVFDQVVEQVSDLESLPDLLER